MKRQYLYTIYNPQWTCVTLPLVGGFSPIEFSKYARQIGSWNPKDPGKNWKNETTTYTPENHMKTTMSP